MGVVYMTNLSEPPCYQPGLEFRDVSIFVCIVAETPGRPYWLHGTAPSDGTTMFAVG